MNRRRACLRISTSMNNRPDAVILYVIRLRRCARNYFAGIPHLLLFRQDHSVSISGQSCWRILPFRRGDDGALLDGITQLKPLMVHHLSAIPSEFVLQCWKTVDSMSADMKTDVINLQYHTECRITKGSTAVLTTTAR